MTDVPYRGASPALNDLIPGRVDCYFGSGALLENMRSGQLRELAVTGAKRDPVAAELPTVAEAGVPVTRYRRGTACSCRPGRRLKSSGK
jgi:tripartite-type tricarboxylate transporter receptor subunit TctC